MGRINIWKTTAALAVGFVATAGTGVAMAQGGLTANLALSGTLFDVVIGDVNGKGFTLFVDRENMGAEKAEEAVTRLTFEEAAASDLCVSAVIGNVPSVGPVTFKLTAEGNNTVDADHLVVGAKYLAGDLTMSNVLLGADTNQANPSAPPGAWGLVSDTVNVQARQITATSVAANKLSLRNVAATVNEGEGGGCGA